ncbi:MAG: trypsin-like peptidase domain-containing protein [Pirellulaceae bacterium]
MAYNECVLATNIKSLGEAFSMNRNSHTSSLWRVRLLAGLMMFSLSLALHGSCTLADEGDAAKANEPNESPPRPAPQVDEGTSEPTQRAFEMNPSDESLAHLPLSFAFRNSAQKALPSVVTIFSRSKEASAANPVLDIIGGERAQKFDSVGSGVIISSDGLILTNHHVVADAAIIEVRLQDGRQFRAENPRSDPQSDVAILKIDVHGGLPAAEIGDSDTLFVGDWVIAIGSPFMIESSVSAGIISGMGRSNRCREVSKGSFCKPTQRSTPAIPEDHCSI